eukprot:scaffold1026_cov409-Prasinococcus_capsulatus_cf.AAC.11
MDNFSAEDLEALQAIGEATGFTANALVNSAHAVERLDLFMGNIARMGAVQCFPNLEELSLLRQEVSRIEGLDKLTRLKKLWLEENRIQALRGLQNCHALTHLFLSSNQIKRVDSIGSLGRLKVLWLANNDISDVTGLEQLADLRELNLAMNRLSDCPEFHGNPKLESLNLSGNPIGSFRAIRRLSHLKLLKHVCFADPHYRGSPIAALQNYQTYAFANLPRLLSLDTQAISEDSKRQAQSEYARKRMHYRMLIKAVRRATNSFIRQASQGKQRRKHRDSPGVSMMFKEIKDIERDLAAPHALGARFLQEAVRAQLRDRKRALEYEIERIALNGRALDSYFAACSSAVEGNVDRYHRRLRLALESGGNIRLEDGQPSDSWYSFCASLVCSRLSAAHRSDSTRKTRQGVNILGVTRIHNVDLRTRFEERLAEVTDGCCQLDYLFCQELGGPTGFEHLLEEGFLSAWRRHGRHGESEIRLSSSVPVSREYQGKPSRTEWTSALTLVVRVCLGKGAVPVVGSNKGGREPSSDPRHTSRAMSSLCQGDFKRTYRILDPVLVLPAYLVEFQYEEQRNEILREMDSRAYEHVAPVVAEALQTDVKGILRPLHCFLVSNDTDELGLFRKDLGLSMGLKDASSFKDSQSCSMFPITSRQSARILAMTRDVLEGAAFSSQLDTVRYLSFHNSGIRRVEKLSQLPLLRTLVLSFNEISEMASICNLVHLEHLDLSYNSIARIEGLENMPMLKQLELNSNCLQNVEDIGVLHVQVPQLLSLRISSNPMCDNAECMGALLQLQNLEFLDGRPIAPNSNSPMATNISVKQTLISENPKITWDQTEVVALESRRIENLCGMESLPNVRKAAICHNKVATLVGLESCCLLEELYLEDNRISSTDGLSGLVHLTVLEIGRNRLCGLGEIAKLESLTQLSIEDNEIASLFGLQQLVKLEELYVGNNKVSELRQLQNLKDLPKLAILDAAGNPMCSDTEYRSYTIYQLSRLRVLDAIGIDTGQVEDARSRHAERLSLATLEDLVGDRSWGHLGEIDLSFLKLRDLGGVFLSGKFNSLQELNLDSNNLTDVAGLRLLGSLRILHLNNNRLGNRLFVEGSMLRVESESRQESLPVFSSLEVLHLAGNGISHLKNFRLQSFERLKGLFLQDNELTTLEGLSECPELRELVLNRNKLQSLSRYWFKGLRSLSNLHIESNRLRSMMAIPDGLDLRTLHLGHNRITDMRELRFLSKFKSLEAVSLVSNPIARKEGYRAAIVCMCCTKLQLIDEKPVTEEERYEYQTQQGCLFEEPTGYQVASIQGSQNTCDGKCPLRLGCVSLDPSQVLAPTECFHSPRGNRLAAACCLLVAWVHVGRSTGPSHSVRAGPSRVWRGGRAWAWERRRRPCKSSGGDPPRGHAKAGLGAWENITPLNRLNHARRPSSLMRGGTSVGTAAVPLQAGRAV